MTVVVDGHTLSLADVQLVARQPTTSLQASEQSMAAAQQSRELKERLMADRLPIYGITTGFGDSVTSQIAPEKAADLQRNLIRYHLNGTGSAAPEEVVRATMLIRANCLARGHSGVQPSIVERLLELLRQGVLPEIPERGSVGASGDLVPLCYLASVVIGEGPVRYGGTVRDAADVLDEIGLKPIVLEAKDGLGLINGTSFSTAYAVLAAGDAAQLAAITDICTALASEALLGNRGHFDPFIHQQRPHPGQLVSAANLRGLLADSELALPHSQIVDMNDPLIVGGHTHTNRSIQDRYSIRCAPHVAGVLRDTLTWVETWLDTEINSSTDNPLFDVASGAVHSGGNFYAGHVAQAMDSLKVAVSSVADLLDRQLELMVDEKFNNGLTPNLIPRREGDHWEAGLNHGFKGMQIAASALAAEALKGSGPASTFSRSTEAHNQDKVSMSAIAARDARLIVTLTREVAAIHLLAACQALDLRGVEQMSSRTHPVYRQIRRYVPFADTDRRMDGDIQTVVALIKSGALVAAAGLDTAGS
ncbi:histidine ammonia-lyase/phenylalanine ammonia-lyase [Jatrophihabitans sp. GAS493]|uniref:HAL/PAL/TAL family ammonia-lyase n=1 Tax=Jatrophihabitans sp. GAS493 TaxID=1907575 RepID=UPI000BB79997|nr:aromatic amino acid ammonia-lyase [Jatrophihabitans sp. GAS493]SOD75063.1 histidine ammonia-lyase/phenylalanine ammonia-lyase [Jatrophihabitans sp. GAS493]